MIYTCKVTLYYLQMYLKTLEIRVLKCMNWILLISYHYQDWHGKHGKKTNVKLELLTDYDMLLMVEEGIRGGICHSIQRYTKTNNKYIKNYDENEKSSYIQYLNANNLYGWVMSQKFPVNGFK